MGLDAISARNMLTMQSHLNDIFLPGWRENPPPYGRAILVEAVEGLDHHGWKWWGAQPMNLAQLRMELVDIWHFMLSHLLISCQHDLDKAVGILTDKQAVQVIHFDGKAYPVADMDLLSGLELMAGLGVSRRISVSLFKHLLKFVELPWAELYVWYIGKNSLNRLRQEFGYKQGTYQKIWDGREDNVHLAEIQQMLDFTVADYPEQLALALRARYPG